MLYICKTKTTQWVAHPLEFYNKSICSNNEKHTKLKRLKAHFGKSCVDRDKTA